jgi:hypothetical protein
MDRLVQVLVIASACIASPVLAATLSQKVPAPFQGRWNADPKYCGEGESQLEILANEIVFYENSGPIRAVVAKGKYEVALIAELSGEEEEPFLDVRHFRLSKDQKELSDITRDPPYVRHRCP